MTSHVAWIVAAMQLAATAAAADPTEDAALAHLDRGVAAYRAGDFARAHDELLEANRMAPDRPNPYRWLALAEAELDDCQSALINIEAFLSRVPADDARVAELVALRDRCQHTSKVDIDSTPAGASIRLDGGPAIGHTPAKRLVMRTGRHVVTLEKPGFAAQSTQIDVRAFGTNYATFQLRTEQTSITHRWWFWVAIGAVAATAGGLIYEASQSDAPPGLPPVTCTASGCHP
ncbi:MAG TPA: PEGA domain-containing protein [Kofleriaceae bacterium]|nr:PEGA domain-containing protein [Kofleriaceae bacterium]